MKRRHTPPRTAFIRLAALFGIVYFVASMAFLFFYQYDNKYTSSGVQPRNGILQLSDEELKKNPKVFLVHDWEIYRGVLLTPEDFISQPPVPSEYSFIGQYGGFEGANRGSSPHGSATYRLLIDLPSDLRSYTLELPEIYSAYRLYINGILTKQMGEPSLSKYSAHTGNSSVSIQTANKLEILIAVSDYSYLYSGMVYPPAFGNSQAVTDYLNIRYSIRISAMIVAICIGLIASGIWVLSKPLRKDSTEQDLTLLYALLCFCYVGYIGYPVIKTLFPGGLEWYYLENFCYCLIFLLIGLIQHRISDYGGRTTEAFVLLGLFVCCCSVLVPYFLPQNLALMMAYSKLLKLYTYTFALFLTASTSYCVYKGKAYSTLMATGIVVFDCGLIFDRALPNFEPILFGWFNEISATVLVFIIGMLMTKHVAKQYRTQLILEEQVAHTTQMLQMQGAYYPILLEKEQEARALRHDLRHHFLILRELTTQGNLATLATYLDEYQMAYIQPNETSYCEHYVIDMLLRLYAQRAKQNQIRFRTNIDIPESLPISNVDLCVIISNLTENAIEACTPLEETDRKIHIGIIYKMSRLSIVIDNSFDGQLQLENGNILSRKRKNLAGVGLTSVKSVSKQYEGVTHFYPDEEKKIFHSEVLLTARLSAPPATQ